MTTQPSSRAAATATHARPALALALALASCAAAPPRLDERAPFEARLVPSADVAAGLGVDAADGLDRAELLTAAYERDAGLRRALADLAETAAAADAAGTLPDPRLSLTALRFDYDADDPWFLAGALEFVLPFLSTRRFDERAARARVDGARARVDDEARRVWRETHALWVAAWADARRREAHAEAAADLERLRSTVASLAAAGEVEATASRRLEGAAARAGLAELRAERRLLAHAVEARARVDWPEPVALVVGDEPLPATLDGGGDRLDPRVALALAELAATEERLAAAARGAFDGATIGPAGEWEDGEGRWGLALGLPLPIFGRTAAVRAVALARRERAALEVGLASAAVDAQRRRTEADLDAARAELDLVRGRLLPLALEDWRRSVELFQAGELSALDLVDAVAARLEARLLLVDAREREALALIERASLGASAPAAEEDQGGRR